MDNRRRKSRINQSTASIPQTDSFSDFDTLDLIPNQDLNFPQINNLYFREKAYYYLKYTLKCLLVILLLFPLVVLYRLLKLENTIEHDFDHLTRINLKLRQLNNEIKTVKFQLNDLCSNDTVREYSKLVQLIDTKIESALNLYDADKIGELDYAMESLGGSITSTPDTKPIDNIPFVNVLGISMGYTSNPTTLIQPQTLPGQCFAFKGQMGKIRIQLAHSVFIRSVTLEHVHKNLVLNANSAPKDFRVYGLQNEKSITGYDLGLYQYKLHNSKTIQTFQLKNLDNIAYKHVELQILTNHGNPDYTCVYRFRVHGNKC